MTDTRVLWVSTGRSTRGGISRYVETMAGTALWPDWRIGHLATHVDGTRRRNAVVFGRSLARMAGLLLRDPPDLVHVHTASRGSFARKAAVLWLASAARVPVVLHVHGGGFDRFHDGAPAPVRALIRATLRRADRVLALGAGWERWLSGVVPGARVVAVPNPVRGVPAVGHPPSGPVRVLFAGRLGAGKGVPDLLDAWGDLRPAAARLVLAGDGDLPGARRRIAELGLDGVEVAGWLPHERLLATMAGAHVLVLPSRSEGQPIAVLEAMAHGLCVVACAVGGIPDLLTDEVSGLLVPPADPVALAAALRRVLDDAALRARLGAAARERVRAVHDAGVVAARLDALYREVLAGRGVTDLPGPAPRSA